MSKGWAVLYYLLSPMVRLIDALEVLSWRLGGFLDGWLPHARVRTSRSSRFGRFLLDVTESCYYPTFCETFWGTVARPFKARVMRWVYLLGGIIVGMLFILTMGLFIGGSVRDYGVGTTLKWTGFGLGAFIAGEAVLLLLVGTARFAAEHLCPVKFEIDENGEGA